MLKMTFFRNTYTAKVIVTALAVFSSSCSDDYLEEMTYGEISPTEMTSPGNVDKAIIAAYSSLNGQYDGSSSAFNSPASNWSFGDVVSDDAYKGGGGTGDQNNIHLMEIFNVNPAIIDLERKWVALYEGVKRTNEAMRLLQSSEEYNPTLKESRMGELYFLRGHYYFELKKIYNTIPYIDEAAATVNDYAVSHTQFTSEQLWNKIEENFSKAYDRLPASQEQVGRPNKMTAKAYLAKAYIFQKKWQQALDAANEVINSNKYSLLPHFRDVFLPENDNSAEIIFAVQHSVLDGAPDNYNGSIGDRLSAPGGPFYSQYGFHRPSQNLINAYKTNANGMPVLDNVNVAGTDFVDPRLDHTVGRPGIPYLDLGVLYEANWARDLSTYGPFAPKKRIVSANSPYQTDTWPYISALNYYILRYADLLLWKAEALVELDDLEGARAVVNQVRGRARDSRYVMNLAGTAPAANYRIETYSATWSDKVAAREAVRTERRLELALEGHRFFDLVRWGVAAETINNYLAVERTRRSHLTNANFTAGMHEYFPVPQKYFDVLESMK